MTCAKGLADGRTSRHIDLDVVRGNDGEADGERRDFVAGEEAERG